MNIDRLIKPAGTGRILWPSLGNPHLISDRDKVIRATVVVKRDIGVSDAVTKGFRLTAVAGPSIDIELTTRGAAELGIVDQREPFWRTVLRDLGLTAFEVTLEASDGIPLRDARERRVILCNLRHEALEGGRHSVAYAVHGWSSYRFLYAADAHVAAAWDEVERSIAQVEVETPVSGEAVHGELLKAFGRSTFRQCFVNPNKNFAGLLRSANEMARAGRLDFIILGGDMVDYVNKSPRGRYDDSYQGSNYSLFEAMVTGEAEGEPLEVPLFTQTGNHDYRLWPYRFASYGLKHCGLHDLQTRFLLGLKRRPGISFPTREDLDSITARLGRRHSLTDYLWRINPRTDYSVDIGDVRFIFLDTGRDAFLAWRELRGRWGNLLRSLRSGVGDPDSEGLWDRQLGYLREQVNAARERPIVLLLHAPLFNPVGKTVGDMREPARDEERLLLKLGNLDEKITVQAAVAIERQMIDGNLKEGCIFQNHAGVLQAACQDNQTWLALSGHIHRNVEVRLDRQSGQVYQGDYTSGSEGVMLDQHNSYFLSPNALGHVQSRHEAPGTPEFYEVSVEKGCVKNVIKYDLLYSNGSTKSAFFVREQRHPDGKLLRITFHKLGDDPQPRRSGEWLAVTFWIIKSRKSCRQEASPMEVVPLSDAGVHTDRVDTLSPAQSDQFFGDKLHVSTHRFRLHGRDDALFLIQWPSSRRQKTEIVVTGEADLAGPSDSKGLRVFWHPRSFFMEK